MQNTISTTGEVEALNLAREKLNVHAVSSIEASSVEDKMMDAKLKTIKTPADDRVVNEKQDPIPGPEVSHPPVVHKS